MTKCSRWWVQTPHNTVCMHDTCNAVKAVCTSDLDPWRDA